MQQFGYIKYLFATGFGLIAFLGSFYFFSAQNEPVELAVGDSEFIPVEIVEDTLTPQTPPVRTPEVFVEEEVVEEIGDPLPPPATNTQEITSVFVEEKEELPPAPSFVPENLSAVDQQVRGALVNILCIASGSSPAGSISGSGIIIDPSGTILTNAHIAQVMLIEDYPFEGSIECIGRTGSPAKDQYTLELAYISPQWVLENAEAIASDNPTGTGESDFALLRITGPTEFGNVPKTFPFVSVSFNEVKKGQSVISAGYPASFLEAEAIRRNLNLISVAGLIEDVFTFARTTVDVFSLGGIVLAQQGASGGAVVDFSGNLIGLIVTSSLEPTTKERDLRAISTAHIARNFSAQHSVSFAQYAFGNIVPEANDFNENIAPPLRDILLSSLGVSD